MAVKQKIFMRPILASSVMTVVLMMVASFDQALAQAETCIIADCTTCVPGTPKKCTQCRPGYGTPSVTDQSYCIKCSSKSGCALCSTLTMCSKCQNVSLVAKQDGSGECEVPPCRLPDCSTCAPGNSRKCAKCRPGFGTRNAGDQSTCVRCSTKPGCAQCSTLTLCTKCATTYLGPKMDGSGECATCAANCSLCSKNGAGKCDRCKTGFTLQADNTCAGP